MLSFDRLPVTGPCAAYRPPGHAPHVLDLVGLGERVDRPAEVSLWRALGSLSVERFHGWRRTIVAPTVARVVTACDGIPDQTTVRLLRDVPAVLLLTPMRAGRDLPRVAGNHVVLETANGFVLLAHLRCDSLVVNADDTLAAGDPLGEVGNSGNSLIPHTHVQAMSTPDPFTAVALPWRVSTLERQIDGDWQSQPGPIPLRVPVRSNGSN